MNLISIEKLHQGLSGDAYTPIEKIACWSMYFSNWFEK